MSMQPNDPGRFTGFLRGFDGRHYFDIQHRNFEALAKMSSCVGRAASEIGECQLEMLRSFASLAAPAVSNTPKTGSGIGGQWESQLEHGRSFVELASEQMRQVNTVLRECTSEIAGEIEACTRDNFKTLGAKAEEFRAEAEKTAQAATDSFRANTEAAARKTSEVINDSARKMSETVAKVQRSAPAAE